MVDLGLSGQGLTRVVMAYGDLSDTSLEETSLTDANLTHADLRGMGLSTASIEETTITGAKADYINASRLAVVGLDVSATVFDDK